MNSYSVHIWFLLQTLRYMLADAEAWYWQEQGLLNTGSLHSYRTLYCQVSPEGPAPGHTQRKQVTLSSNGSMPVHCHSSVKTHKDACPSPGTTNPLAVKTQFIFSTAMVCAQECQLLFWTVAGLFSFRQNQCISPGVSETLLHPLPLLHIIRTKVLFLHSSVACHRTSSITETAPNSGYILTQLKC